MIIPAWHIAILATAYAGEYVYRYFRQLERRYIYLGKGLARFILALVYWYITIFSPGELQRQVLVRWSLFWLLSIDLYFIALEYVIAYKKRSNG